MRPPSGDGGYRTVWRRWLQNRLATVATNRLATVTTEPTSMSEQDDLANSMDQTEGQPADLGQLASQLFSESELQAGLAAAYNSDGLAGMAGLAQRIACPGDVVAGRYRLIEMIGEGGMSTVWYAEQLVPVKRKVALKLIKPAWNRARSSLASKRSVRHWR